ncbi:hypothetical protein UPYG_G00178770 [Umbra pygmaea]|uniref:CAP-Gly domain-containing protein n=1 Tax=Umbra pygmaea TaxID=75934 RepID=A0ABD0XB57_UMBPY
MPVMTRPGFWTGSGLNRLFSSGGLRNYDDKTNTKEHLLSKQGSTEDSNYSNCHTVKCMPRSQSACAGISPQCDTVKTGVKDHFLTGHQTEEKIQTSKSHPSYTEEKRLSEKIVNKDTLAAFLHMASSLKNISIRVPFSNTSKAKSFTVSSNTGSPFLSESKENFDDDQKMYEVQDKKQELPKMSCTKLYPVDPGFTIEVMCDPVTLNVQNDQRSRLLPIRNNVDNNPQLSSVETEEVLVSQQSVNIIDPKDVQQNMKTKKCISNTGCLFTEPFVHKISNGETKIRPAETPSCDGSASETEDEFDKYSSSSECLTYFEEDEKALIDGARDRGNKIFPHFTHSSKNESQTQPSCQNPARINHSFSIKTFTEPCMPLVLKKSEMSETATKAWSKTMLSEEGLSEILSPVDEVLSYGSCEFPPSAMHCPGYGSLSSSLLPPQPAFEVITWTSEEDFPSLFEGHELNIQEDQSVNSERVSPLPDDLAPHLNRGAFSGDAKLSMASSTAHPTFQNVFHQMESSVLEDEDEIDPQFPFEIGDRVILHYSQSGVVKYKGPAAFAGGFWADMKLDQPDGNHNGTVSEVHDFRCERNCGVLVRPSDISHSPETQDSDLDTGVEEDAFSDDEQPNYSKSEGAKASGVHRGVKALTRPLETNRFRIQNISLTSTSKITRKEEDFQEKGSQKTPPYCSEMTERSRFSSLIPESPLFQIDCDSCQQTAPHTMSTISNLNSWVERLTEELIQDFIMDALEIWMRTKEKDILNENNRHSDTTKKKEDTAVNKLCFIEQWHDTLNSADPGNVQVQPHDQDIVYRLVDTAVETLLGHAKSTTMYVPEAPGYIIDEESIKAYGQIMYQLISEILHEVLADRFGITRSMWQKSNILSSLVSSRISLTDMKAAVRSEVQKELNLEKTDLQTKERLLKLCKYRSARRDRVDYILIQELHKEELQWVDYSADQITVKMKLSEEIFSLLLEDTISVLKHIYMTPSF